VTYRKEAEDELFKQKEVLQKIVDHIPVMINFTDGEGRLKLVNQEWQKTLGWSLDDCEVRILTYLPNVIRILSIVRKY